MFSQRLGIAAVAAAAAVVMSASWASAVGSARGLGPPTKACEKGLVRNLALISVPDGVVDCGFPDPRGGSVERVLSDGRGGWFAGGSFTGIGAVSAPSLVHLHHDGSLDLSWHAALPADKRWASSFPPVRKLALVGSTLYAAGPFGVEAVDAASGTRRWLMRTNGRNGVLALAANRDAVFVGGDFHKVGGHSKSWLVALDAATGRLRPWKVDLLGPLPMVDALALSGRRLYLGGDGITAVGGRTRPGLAAVNAATGAVLRWLPGTAQGLAPGSGVGDVETIVAADGQVFTAGHDGFGITNARTGKVESTAYKVFGSSFASYGDIVYLGGDCRNGFIDLQAKPRNNLGSLDLSTGRVTAWAPNVASYTCVGSIAATSDEVLVAGGFSKTLR
jgi:PQQ-like domain